MITIVVPSRAESGPLQSVIAALPGAVVTRFDSTGMTPAIAMSQGLTYFTAMFTAQKASRVVLLGDRYETLAAALAAMFLKIPVAHIHGGETTTGAWDDALRHSISHIADLHFVATLHAAQTVSSLMVATGRTGTDIKIVGAPGLDGVEPNSARRDQKLILCTYHSETLAENYGLSNCFAMLEALDAFPDHTVMFTPPNNDPGNEEIKIGIDFFIKSRENWHWIDVGHMAYVQLMQSAQCVVGNSSAGIIEAPWIGVPSVNIGLRQDGRDMAMSIRTWTNESEFSIADAIRWSMSSTGPVEPIYKGGAAEKVAAILLQDRQGDTE